MPTDSFDTNRRPRTNRQSTTESLRRGRGPPVCNVPHCNGAALFFTGPDDKIILSRHCKRHTCQWAHPPYDMSFCDNAVEIGDEFCDQHRKLLTCASTTQPCLRQREYDHVADSVDPTASWFCSTHRCGHDRCENEGKGSDQDNRRCDKHKQCSVQDCMSPPDVQNYSFYCKQHTCRSAHCAGVAKKNNLCTEHQLCSRRSCDKPRYIPDEGLDDMDEDPLCEAHYKQNVRCANPDCRRPKEKGKGQYCSEHECKAGECAEERGSSGSPYCHKHRCRKDGCPNPLLNTGNSPFCPKHTCKVPSCQRSTASASSPHCETHTCSKPDCNNPVDNAASSITPGKPLPPLCKVHKCKFASCSEEATPISETTAGYCLTKHGCVEADCPKGRLYDDQGTPFERCADHERQRWKDAGRKDAEEAQEAKEDVRKRNELKKERQHNDEKEGLKKEIKELRDIINGPHGFEAFREELEDLRKRNAELEDIRLENADLRAELEGLRAAHETHQARLRKGRRPSMAAPGPGGYAAFGLPGGHQFPGPGPMLIPTMNGSKIGRESPTGRSFRGSSAWDTSRDSLLSQQYDDHDHPYYSEEDRGGTPTDISFDHSSEHDPSQPQRGRIRDVSRDWREPPTPGREARGRDARELRDKSRGRVGGGTTETIKDAGAVARSPRDKSKPRRTKSKHRGTATGGYGAFDTMRRRNGAGLSQWQGDAAAQAQAPPLSSRRSKTFGTGTAGKPRPVSMMAGSVPDAYAGGYGHPIPGHTGYWGQRGHGEFYESEE
ncbi:hypothetical protein SMACR_04558 [Sordaria macrospora]|uniref:Uncharacterized protein n=1 Tax=Sordaria macrospora TaxID=5147 RepID=A0A8S8ZHE6_SORMA|nr:hypothetical protein SMACR_04558 [Sordaria macrospora]KAH7631453.1 hypothetical protein B0T09DRAFT_372560 [Sordaria sp. MPI-SDFR-AT-0083]WPJ62779.1 hypothetical protein SMAC4_04558 [Sordaria macrospora]